MFANSHKIVLCVTNHSLTAGLWHGTKLHSYQRFKNQDQDHTAFSQYLAKHSNINIYLIVDAVEEDYKIESLPHTTGGARREIIERKLNQFNRSSLYRTAHFINRSTDKRKDDNFLFVALSNADFLQSWMDVIQASHTPLVGVYLLPMISQVVVRQMKLMAPNILLCERLSSGLRQTYLHNGRLRMSRLAPMTEVKPNQLAYFYLVEIEKTRLYLLSQRLILGETALQMVLPAPDSTYEEIAKSISQDQGIECKTVDILAYAKNCNIAHEVVKAHPELLHMQLLVNGNVPDNLAPVTFTKTYNLNKICHNIYLASAGIAVAGIMLAGYYYWQGRQQINQVSDVVAQTQQQLQQYTVVAQNFPATPIPSNDLKIAAEIAQTIKTYDQTPRQLMQVLSAACEQSPEIMLNRVRWVQTNLIDIKDEDTTQLATTASNVQPVPVNDPSKLRQIGFINAEIKGFSGDYRAALASVSRLAGILRADTLVEQVVILQEPVNVSSLANLQGSTKDEGNTERTPAIFKLKVVLKPIQNGAKG
ncbi:MAG: hypothetical protein ACT4OH_08120 [Methylophilaceae bacterium]